MTSFRVVMVVLLGLACLIGCATPLTVAEPRDAVLGTPPPGEFGETGPLDSGFANDADTFVADPGDAAGDDG